MAMPFDYIHSLVYLVAKYLFRICCSLLVVAAMKMTMELEQRFPPSQVMDALNIVYPQFWLAEVNEIELH
jgi:hypothetical protein